MKGDILGWSGAVNRFGDGNGRCHLLVEVDRGGHAVGVPACGTKGRTSGAVHREPPGYAPHKCLNCERARRGHLKAGDWRMRAG